MALARCSAPPVGQTLAGTTRERAERAPGGDHPLTSLVRATCIASAVTLLLTTGGASAQPQPPQQRLDLHAILHIRPDQEAGWRAFQGAQAPPAGVVSELRASAGRMAGMTTPQRLDTVIQNRQLEDSILHHQFDAIRHFYAALTPDQQRIYDQVTTPHPANGSPPQR